MTQEKDLLIKNHTLVYQPDKELEWALEKVYAVRSDLDLRNCIPTDLNGNKLDKKKKIGELGTLDIVLGPEMREWTLAKAQEYIYDYLTYISFKEKQPFVDQFNKQDTIFRIYLPGGTFSCVGYEAKKHLTLMEILDSKSIWSKYGIDSSTPAITFKGNVLDMNCALDDTGVRDICLGTDILDWAMAHYHNPPDKSLSSNVRRVRFLDELVKFQQMVFESSRTSRDKHKVNSAPKSPHRKSKTRLKQINLVTPSPNKTTDYSKMIERLEENSPDKVDGEYPYNFNTSIWHMQNSKKNYYEHYLHWIDEEINYKTNYMVPYKFLKQPKYKKHLFKTILNEQNNNKTLLEFTFNETDEQSEDTFIVWQESMENKVFLKLQEHQTLSVSFIGSLAVK